MKKMYVVNAPKKDTNVITIKPRKTRVQLTTCKSATYSFYTKASKKSERNLKNSLKRLDLSNLIWYN